MLRPVTPYVAFHYRSLQKQLLKAKIGKRIPSRIIQLSQESKIDLTWWVKSSGFKSHSTAHLREQKPTVHIWTDASLTGSGAHDSRGRFTQREWTATELASDPHINVLELIAAKEAVAELVMKGDVVRLHLDNRVACAYIARQGGTKSNALVNPSLSTLGFGSVKASNFDNPTLDINKRQQFSRFPVKVMTVLISHLLNCFL